MNANEVNSKAQTLTGLPSVQRVAELMCLALLGCAALCWMKGIYVYLGTPVPNESTSRFAMKCGLAGLAMGLGGLAILFKSKEKDQKRLQTLNNF